MRDEKPGRPGSQAKARARSLRTVELFAGIGGFRVAADRLGLTTCWANDLCPKACQVYRDRFGNRELVEGDLRDCLTSIPDHDVLTAGFPCQPFSSAGKKAGIRDPRGTLFQLIIDVLVQRQPRFFVLENVKRLLTMEQGRHFATILASLAELGYRVEWRLLNARHFGLPQNRERVVFLGELAAAVSQPRLVATEDLPHEEEWAWCEISKHRTRFPTWGVAQQNRFHARAPIAFREASTPVTLRSVLDRRVGAEFDFTEVTRRWLTSNTPVNRFIHGVQILSNQGGGARMGYTIFGVEGLAPTLTSTTSRHYERYRVGNRYRRLTNVEYARIQGFADDHCRAVSVYDQYALFGNAVPPPLVHWVLKRLAR